MKCRIILFLLVVSIPSWAAQTRVQHKFTTSCSTSCGVTVTATGTGNLLVVTCFPNAAAGSCTNVTGAGTWVHPAGCASTSTTAGGAVDHWYNLSSTSGVTTITVTFNAANSSGNSAEVDEISTTSTPWSFGACGILSNQTATTGPKSPSLTLGGSSTSNFAATGVFTAGSISAGSTVTGGWTTPIVDAPGGDGFDDILNASSGASQATMTSTSGAYCSSGIWFNDASGGGGTVVRHRAWVIE